MLNSEEVHVHVLFCEHTEEGFVHKIIIVYWHEMLTKLPDRTVHFRNLN